MKKVSLYGFASFALSILVYFSVSAQSQTLTLNDGSVVQSNTNRIGINIGAIDYWDNGQILKNLIGSSNPGFEPLQNQQIWALDATGSTTTFTIPDIYDGVPADYWAGGTFTVVESQSGGAELGCTGTIASNTGPNYPLTGQSTYYAPVITTSTACSAPFSVGDIVIISKVTYPTPEAWWETGGRAGIAGTVTGGAQLLSDTTDLCANCGTQALNMNASVTGSTASATWYYDSESTDNIFILMKGSYQLSFWAKTASGTPTLTASASRGSQDGFNCGTYKPTLTSTWTQYTWTCTAAESATTTTPAAVQVSLQTTGGSVYLDNVSFEKVSTDSTNTTVLRDEVITTLQNYYGPSIGSNPGMFRYWVNQNAESMSNWTQPDYAHMPTSGGTGYFVGPGGAGSENLSLEDYLAICKFLNAEPYLEVPVTITTADAANLIEFLAGPSTTTYGARRAALGQTAPWTSIFSQIHLSFCNECWNGQSFAGQALNMRSSAPNSEYYYDYSVRARDVFAAMRADSYYTASSFDLVMNAQTAVSYSMDAAIARAHPDSIEIEDYTYGDVNSFATDTDLWQSAMIDPWEKVTNPTDIRNFYQSVHDYQSQTTCGASGTSTCKVNIYEWGQGTIGGSIDQTHLDYINAGAGQGVVMALQPLLNMQYYGIRPQSFFALSEYKNNAANSMNSKLWGNVVDMGGATNNVRPTFLGVQLVNQSIIGPMYSCPISSNLTYNFAGSTNGIANMPAMKDVPYLYAFCFENGTKRSLVLINTDLSSSHTLTFSGINLPTGTVTQRQLASAALNDMNEAPTGTATNLTAATVAIETTTLSSPNSISLPPYSVTALDYTASGAQAAAMPTFSPAAGTYTSAQSVTISDTTTGATIYYTTDGSTPTTSSTKYTGAVTVSATETLTAIAVATGYTNSSASSASYTIALLLPTPTFSVSAGTYATTQSVTISDATSGTTIYYTTDGSTPTTSSSVYSSAISVTSTETLQAIAVKTGYTNSAVATATYTIAAALTAPVFSPAAGTYTSPQVVTLTDATSDVLIYYTTDGSTPTTSSAMYSGGIWQCETQTLKAIAVKSGYTTSTIATAAYTIAPVLPTPTFSLAGGPAAYATAQTVSILDSVSGATIYYTTNGTTPTASSTKYTGPITVSATETINAIAIESGYTNSAVGSILYTIATQTLPAPTFSPAAGTYTASQSVTITDATAGTTIYYTTNGTTPTTSSSVYSSAITVSTTETLEAIAVKTSYTNSAVATAAYTIAPVLPTPTFSVAAGTYTTSQSVTISDATAGTTIYYTTNGTTPTTSSSVYSIAITVSATETLEAIAVKTGYTNSAVATAAYTIAPVLPTPTFSVAAGTYTTSQSVTISDATAGTTIYYTTDGTTPTTSSSVYSSAIAVSTTETLEAIAVKTGYTNSATATATYTINTSTSYIAYSSGGFASSNLSLNNGSTVSSGILQLTDGGTGEARSAWYTKKVPVSAFTTDFTFKITKGVADGFTFTIQNDPKSIWALGYSGCGFGYQSIQKSVALTFNIYGTGANSIGIYTNGSATATSTTSLTSSGIKLTSGNILRAHLVYSGTTLTVTVTDTVTSSTTTAQYTVNIPTIVGSSTAYVGFTASTGAYTAIQQITSWNYLIP
jgi:hypothetical protein